MKKTIKKILSIIHSVIDLNKKFVIDIKIKIENLVFKFTNK